MAVFFATALVAGGVLLFVKLLNQHVRGISAHSWSQRPAHQAIAWEAIAKTLGMEDAEWDEDSLVGRIDGLVVTIASVVRGDDDLRVWATRITVAAGGRIPADIVVSDEKNSRAPWSGLVADVRVNDPVFDRQVHVRGDEATLLAMLQAETRMLIRQLVARDVQVSKGVLEFDSNDRAIEYVPVRECVRSMVAGAKALALEPEEVPARLAANVAKDPADGVRMRSLELLQKQFPETPAAREAVRAALKDRVPALRLAAARASVDAKAVPVLRALVIEGEEAIRLEAIELLLERFPDADVGEAIDAALGSGSITLRAAALRAIGASRDVTRLQRVLDAARADCEEPIGEACAAALRGFGDARGESALVRLLEHSSTVVRREAARALGAVGTVLAVEPLLVVSRRLRAPAEVTDAAREAVRRIQARLGRVESGRLSVADEEGSGGLSLADAGGELAIAESSAQEGESARSATKVRG